MVVSVIFNAITGSAWGAEGDYADALNHKYTALTFVFLAILSMTTALVGKPITCWTPAHYHPMWVKYTDAYCWVKNTYYIPVDTHTETARDAGDLSNLVYYQWVPVILAVMAMMFYLPNSMWKGALANEEIDLNKVINTVDNFELVMKPEDRVKKNMDLADFLFRHFNSQASLSQLNPIAKVWAAFCSKDSGSNLVRSYMMVKLLMVANAVGQLFVLNLFLGEGYHLWGWKVLGDMISGDDWSTESVRFPRITLCDFRVRDLAQIRDNTVQCVLPINLFNEKIFLFVWWWLVIIAILNSINTLQWAVKLFGSPSRVMWVKKNIKLAGKHRNEYKNDEMDKSLLMKFINSFLKPDGVFTMRMIAANTTSLNTSDLIVEIWKMFKSRKLGIQPPPYSENPSAPDDLETMG